MSADFAVVKESARDRVLALLWDLVWHGYEELHRTGGIRYSARLLELRRLGYDIVTEGKKESGLRYRLRSRTPGEPQGKRVKVFLDESDAVQLFSWAKRAGMGAATQLRTAIESFHHNRDKL